MNKKQTTRLAFSMLAFCAVACGTSTLRAGDFDLKDTVDTKGTAADVGEGNFDRQKFTLTVDTRFGYDDNTLAQPDTVPVRTIDGRIVNRGEDKSGSAFFNVSLGVNYLAATPRATLTIAGDVGVNYYLDRPGRNYDVNGGLNIAATYKLTPRLFLEASSYNAYISDGDYGATNLTNFNGLSGAGRTPGTTADRNGDYYYTTNDIAATLQLSTRLSLVSRLDFVAFAYDDTPYSTDQDRIETYFSEEIRYLVQPLLTLTADYRIGYVDYFGVNSDSLTHFLLGGFDYAFNPRLRASIRAGVEFRSYLDSPGDETSPYAEATVTYDVSRITHLSFTGRYGIEEGALSTDVTNANTVRLGLNLEQTITPRISAYAGFFFTHSLYQTPDVTDLSIVQYASNSFNEDTYDVAVGARYAINRHAAIEIGYTHTTVDSQIEVRSYDRNRYFGGFRLQF